MFIPEKTPEIVAARVQAVRDKMARSEVSSLEYKSVPPVEGKLADLEHFG